VNYRLEIPKPIKLEVFKRAGGPGDLRCEGCGLPIGGKKIHYDHKHAEVFQNTPKSERKPITADDVQLLGWECCHKPKTISEIKANCHGKRIIAKAAKAQKKSSWRSKPEGFKFDWRLGKYVKNRDD
jgi:hypothetical protein